MKKVECKKILSWRLILQCRKCGKKATYLIDNKNSTPTHGINGWVLGKGHGDSYKETELCPRCNIYGIDLRRYYTMDFLNNLKGEMK